MLQTRSATAVAEAAQASRYTVRFATTPSEIREAQKLRYRVFVEEFGARLHVREPGVDADFYDPFCEHLIVRDEQHGRIVGTYRVLTPAQAARVGGYYSENEFYLTRLENQRSRIVEVGRSCIDPDYRSGAVIALLWAKLAEYMAQGGFGYLIGCASISMADGGHNAANLFLSLTGQHMAPAEYQVAPVCPLPFDALANGAPAVVPPLLKGYLRAGAWICGEPAWDPDFNSADLLVLLPMTNISERYRKHFLD